LNEYFGPNFSWLAGALWPILYAAGTALYLLLATAVLGTSLSIIGAVVRRGSNPLLRYILATYTELFRNTPFLVQLFLIYFGLPGLGIRLSAMEAAILAMTLNYAAYGTEIVGAGIDAVPKGQTEAGLALGIRPRIVFIKIVLPQALRVIFPALASQTVIMFLETAAVSQIAIRELTYEADFLQARTFRSVEVYFTITLIYLGMSVALRRLLDFGGSALLERK
jgi:polar amino acid transport system permease protein